VFRSSDHATATTWENLALSCDGLRAWSSSHGLLLDDGPESLLELDRHLDSWNSDSSHHDAVDLSNEVGIYLGTVIIAHVNDAKWTVWPNGHPVVLLANGTELDVTRLTNDRFRHSGASLGTLYAQATSA
jgi:hypothetical protein